MTHTQTEIGNRIRVAREEAGLTQREVADRLGLSHVGYGSFERGDTMVGIEYLPVLARVLGKPISYFLGLPSELAPDEEELLHLYRSLPDDRSRRMALGAMRAQERASRDE